jgi:hypothetical protein
MPRNEGHCSKESGLLLTSLVPSAALSGESVGLLEGRSCPLVSTSPTAPKVLPASRTCRHRCCGGVRATTADAPARAAGTAATDLAPPGSHYTQRVLSLAVRLVVEDGLPYRAASWHLWRDHRVFVPFATLQNWVEAAGEKSGRPG